MNDIWYLNENNGIYYYSRLPKNVQSINLGLYFEKPVDKLPNSVKSIHKKNCY